MCGFGCEKLTHFYFKKICKKFYTVCQKISENFNSKDLAFDRRDPLPVNVVFVQKLKLPLSHPLCSNYKQTHHF